jgi:hypothetical protein
MATGRECFDRRQIPARAEPPLGGKPPFPLEATGQSDMRFQYARGLRERQFQSESPQFCLYSIAFSLRPHPFYLWAIVRAQGKGNRKGSSHIECSLKQFGGTKDEDL